MKAIYFSLIPYLIYAQSFWVVAGFSDDGVSYDADAQAEYNRVVAAGDTALSLPFMSELITTIKGQGVYANLKYAGTTLSGYEHIVATGDSIGILYDISGNENDLVANIVTGVGNKPLYVNLGSYPAVNLPPTEVTGMQFTSDIVMTNFTVIMLYGNYSVDRTAADYIEFKVVQNSGGALNVSIFRVSAILLYDLTT